MLLTFDLKHSLYYMCFGKAQLHTYQATRGEGAAQSAGKGQRLQLIVHTSLCSGAEVLGHDVEAVQLVWGAIHRPCHALL